MTDRNTSRKYEHVAVLMGGWSAEREVSLSSGRECAAALEGEGYRVTRVDADRDLAARLAELKPDVCFNALHGRWGEDGCVQGLLEVLDIPYTHSGVLASSVAMNKEQTKRIVRAVGVPIADGRVVTTAEAMADHVFEPPYVAKPVAEGSSVGVVIVKHGANRPPEAIRSIPVTRDGELMVERYIPGRELTCGVIGDRVTDIIDIVPAETLEFYDYQAKYAPGGSRHILPAKIPDSVRRAVQKHTLAVHQALGCRGITRSDFRWDEDKDELIFLEVNTQPGMTPTSLIPELAAHAGVPFGKLLAWLVEDAGLNR
ncbi:MAG TPA: D-alanine--D-alanine ligase [Hyphomicrobiaceae bacterium]|nr:D-alanine--D-alanine ligase [Hyphomicrobiaceae bacterium]